MRVVDLGKSPHQCINSNISTLVITVTLEMVCKPARPCKKTIYVFSVRALGDGAAVNVL